MSKVNYDEIQVGDLVRRQHAVSGKTVLGVVVEKLGGNVSMGYKDVVRAHWSNCEVGYQGTEEADKLTGHWKVINFDKCGHETFMGQCIDCLINTEEETKVDELKVYTGKETVQALLEGKTLEVNGALYRLTEKLEVNINNGEGWKTSTAPFRNITESKFTEVVTPQVGDWVKVNVLANTYIGQIERIAGKRFYSHWNNQKDEKLLVIDNEVDWEILSPEQISEYKRELAFSKRGRKLNEFKHGDIVFIDTLGVTSVVITKKNDNEIKLHGINEKGKGYTAKPNQLTPISFVEDQVDLS